MLLSIILPYYNRESWISATLQSLLSQTHRPLEILLVDNASTDKSAQICAHFAHLHDSDDFRIKLISAPQPGACAARNVGLQAATASYVSFFDSDDIMSPSFMTDMAAAIQQYTADIYVVPTRMMWPDGREEVRRVLYTHSLSDQLLTCYLNTQAYVVRRDFLLHCGGWDSQLQVWVDWELGARLLMRGASVHWVNRQPYHYLYQHPHSITGTGYAHAASSIRHSITVVAAQLATLPTTSFGATWALAAKTMIVTAHIAHEGKVEAAKDLYMQAQALLIHHPIHRILATVLYHYVRLGGRGAWRIARVFS